MKVCLASWIQVKLSMTGQVLFFLRCGLAEKTATRKRLKVERIEWHHSAQPHRDFDQPKLNLIED